MEKAVANSAYEKIAKSYNEQIETKPHNAYYDRPAVKSLIPDVDGKTILDAGCGNGIYMKELLEQGASVYGFDASEKMLEFARERVGDKAKLFNAAFEDEFTFLEEDFFDGILSALAITYVNDLESLFKKFNKVLKKDGWFVFSTEHPFFRYNYFEIENYFSSKKVEAKWTGFGEDVSMTSYYHSLSYITEALAKSGFVLERLIEPVPTKDFEKADKKRYDKLIKFPLFICFKAVKVREI